jgi:hypothetical protein
MRKHLPWIVIMAMASPALSVIGPPSGAPILNSGKPQIAQFNVSSATIREQLHLPNLSAGCLTTDPESGVASQSCGTGGGGGGGISSLAVNQNGVQITSPTAAINFIGPPFRTTSVGGGTTAQVNLDGSSVTLQGNSISLSALALSTGSLKTSVTALGVSTTTLQGQVNGLILSTTTLGSSVTTLSGSTTSLQGQVNTLSASTSSLRSSVTALQAQFPVSLSTNVVGNLQVSHLDNGINASITSYWRGDGRWVSPVALVPTTIQTTQSGAPKVTNTTSFNFQGPPFMVSAIGSTTAYIQIDPSSVTLRGDAVLVDIAAGTGLALTNIGGDAHHPYIYIPDGNLPPTVSISSSGLAPGSSNYVNIDPASQQSLGFNISRGTVASLTAGNMTTDVLTATSAYIGTGSGKVVANADTGALKLFSCSDPSCSIRISADIGQTGSGIGGMVFSDNSRQTTAWTGTGGASGIVSPGTFTWTNAYGIAVSTIQASGVVTSTITASSATISNLSVTSSLYSQKLKYNTSSNANVIISSYTAGNGNIYMDQNGALLKIRNGYQNFFVQPAAGAQCRDCMNNICIGPGNCSQIQDDIGMTAIGDASLVAIEDTFGIWQNAAYGHYSCDSVIHGDGLTCIGPMSGSWYLREKALNYGMGVTLLGANTGPGPDWVESSTMSYSTMIGFGAHVSSNNYMVLGGTGPYQETVWMSSFTAAEGVIRGEVATSTPLIVYGAPDQTADWQSWLASDGSQVAGINSALNLYSGSPININNSANTSTVLIGNNSADTNPKLQIVAKYIGISASNINPTHLLHVNGEVYATTGTFTQYVSASSITVTNQIIAKSINFSGDNSTLTSAYVSSVAVFNSSGTFTWTKPANCSSVKVRLCGAGGGGGNGQATTGAELAGTGAGGGACVEKMFSCAELPASTNVVVGAGGAAAGSGGYSMFGSSMLFAGGGGGGANGTGSSALSGGSGGGAYGNGANGTNVSQMGGLPQIIGGTLGYGGAGANSATNQVGYMAEWGGASGGGLANTVGIGKVGGTSVYGGGGGGSGGGYNNTGPVISTGAAGGATGAQFYGNTSGNGGTLGNACTNGGDGLDGSSIRGGQGGGGGGGCATVAGNGGRGGLCGGGGGGGGCAASGQTAGVGGVGGHGCVYISAY